MESSETDTPEPSFPPLLRGEATGAGPFAVAVRRARDGTEPGLVTHHLRPDHLSAALILTPETPLDDAMAVVLAAACGFADSFGSLAPSEVAAQFDWPGGFRINGATCGGLRAAASTRDPAEEPDWLVVGIDVPFFAKAAEEPGTRPDETTLWDEGCSEIEPLRLLESWSRHTLVHIHELLEDGVRRLHSDWTGRAFGIGDEVEFTLAGTPYSGQFMGLDEKGGMVLKDGTTTRILPLSLMLEEV